MVDIADKESTLLASKEQEINLLHQALLIDLEAADATESKAIERAVGKDNYQSFIQSSASSGASKKTGGKLSDLSGAGSTQYLEFSTARR